MHLINIGNNSLIGVGGIIVVWCQCPGMSE